MSDLEGVLLAVLKDVDAGIDFKSNNRSSLGVRVRRAIAYAEKKDKEGKRFNVVIKEIASGKIESYIGRRLTEEHAEKRQNTGLGRIDTSRFFVAIIPVEEVEQ